MEWLTTTTLLHNLRDFSDQTAWSRFADRFHRPIVGFARKSGLSEADAEDAAQETLLAFADGLRRGTYDRTKGRLSHWLFGIAYRQILRGRRTAARSAQHFATQSESTDVLHQVPDENAATAMWDEEWERSILQSCIDRLRVEIEPVTFRAFELAVRENNSAEEVAAELGIPVKAVYNAKHRGLKRVRELREEMEDISDARS